MLNFYKRDSSRCALIVRQSRQHNNFACRKNKPPEEIIQTSLPLHSAEFEQPKLQVRSQKVIHSLPAMMQTDMTNYDCIMSCKQVKVDLPGEAVAGEAFPLNLRIQNLTSSLQQMTLAIGDTSGFVIAGTQAVSVLVTRSGCVNVILISTNDKSAGFALYCTDPNSALRRIDRIAERAKAMLVKLFSGEILSEPAFGCR